MNGYMTTKEAAARWKISEKKASSLCGNSLVPGAELRGGRWLIPEDTDFQAVLGNMPFTDSTQLPVGVGPIDFKAFSSRMYYVDKTLMIRDIIDSDTGVFLFTRPRRFGKTLNMDMIRTYFELTEEDNSSWFLDKKIWRCDDLYRDHQGKYPVIYLSFKDVKYNNWKETYERICDCISGEIRRHKAVLQSEKCDEEDKNLLRRLRVGNAEKKEYEQSLSLLTRMLHEHYDAPCIVMIDEYDIPVQEGCVHGFCEEATGFLRSLLSNALKDNKLVMYAFLTGVLQVPEESILSGLNNLSIYHVLDTEFAQYFGFTADEVKEMAAAYQAEDKLGEIRDWYDGYIFGGVEVYSPWSVANYFKKKCRPGMYWINTSGNDIIGALIGKADADTDLKLKALLNGENIDASVGTSAVYPDLGTKQSDIFSFLLAAGYLKAAECSWTGGDTYECKLGIPNREVAAAFRAEILRRFFRVSSIMDTDIKRALINKDVSKLKETLRKILLECASYMDTSVEAFYHGLVFGMCALFSGFYTTSNRESGEGRYDLELEPRGRGLPGILIEVKSEDKDCADETLQRSAADALKQIRKKFYDTNLAKRNISPIILYGMAFSGKRVEVLMEED